MSGPWDRPAPQNPDDREPSWPAADSESPSQQSSSEPWSAEDPWQERRDSSAWDVWPPADDATYRPDLPTNDPWAESWTDEEGPAASPEPAFEPTPPAEPSRDEPPPAEPPSEPPAVDETPAYEPAAYEPPTYEPPALEPAAYEPAAYEPPAYQAPTAEPVAAEASPEVVAEEAPADVPEPDVPGDVQPSEPAIERVPPAPFANAAAPADATAAAGASRIQPWSSEVDPWGISTDALPAATADGEAEPERLVAGPEPSEPEASAEPVATEPEVAAPEPAAVGEPAADEPMAAEVASAEPVAAEPEVVAPGPAAEEAATVEPAVEEPATVEPEIEQAAADTEPDESAPEEPDWRAAPSPVFGTIAAAPAAPQGTLDTEAADEGDAGDRPGTEGADDDGRGAGIGLAALAAGAAVAPAAAPEPTEPEASERHEPPWAAALWGDDPPASIATEVEGATAEVEPPIAEAPPAELPAEPADEVWPPEADADAVPPVGDHTEVFPTGWMPPPVSSRERESELDPVGGTVRTSLAERDLLAEAGAADHPSTAEQAVPWLIGLILLLAGMVIVLLALIFAGDASLGGAAALPSGSADPSPSLMAGNFESPSTAASASTAPSAAPTATPVPPPQYGPLEMVYQGRSAALAPIYLLRRDFTIVEDPAVLAQDANLDVRRHAWSPDGRVGAGLLADVLVSIEPGKEKRRLGDGIATITFGDDASTVYAVRVTEDGGNDVASVLAIEFASGDTEELASVSYPRPSVDEEAALKEAQLSDDGGTVRIFWMDDGSLLLFSRAAGTWAIDPASGDATKLDGKHPQLWSADGHHHIAITDEDGTSTLALSNGSGAQLATTTVEGLVSHLRWSPDGKRVVFTVGHSASGGGVLQDLFLWDLRDGQAPMQLTSTGAAFGAEWLGTAPRWSAG